MKQSIQVSPYSIFGLMDGVYLDCCGRYGAISRPGVIFLIFPITLLTLKEYTENKQEELTRVNKNVLFVGAF